MSAHSFGILSEYMVYIAFLIVVLTFGMETTYFRYSQDKEEEPKVFSQLLLYVLCLSFLFCIGLIAFSPQINTLLGATGNENYIKLLAGILFLDAVSALPFARLRNINSSLKFISIKVTSILLNVILNILFVWFLPIKLGMKDLVFGNLSFDLADQVSCVLWANLLANSIFLFFFAKDLSSIGKYWDKKYFKPAIKYAYPVMILGLAGLINELIDRLMLKEILPFDFYKDIHLSPVEAMGIYSANYKFAIFITLAIQAYRYAAEPFFFKTQKDKNSKETFAKLMTVFSLILLFSATFISVFRQEIGLIILRNEIFRLGIDVVPILLLANVCVGIYYNLSAWYKLTDKTIYGTLIGIFGAILTLIINYLFIPYLGFMACAYATLICYASMMLISYFLGQKYYPVPYNIKKIGFYFLSSIIVIYGSIYLIEPIPYAFVYKLMLMIGCVFFLYKFEFRKVLKS